LGKEGKIVKNKMIVIEGTDCSGKATQTRLLKERLEKEGQKVFTFSFPDYESPTGKIIGGPYLGKEWISKGWFPEGAPNVDPKASSMFFALDRYYNFPKIYSKIQAGYLILLDRYTYSAMAHQGGKLKTFEERNQLYEWIGKLEFEMLNLPEPEVKIFLHLPFTAETLLRKNRQEENLDENEKDDNHLKNAEIAYLELSKKYHFQTIECTKKQEISSIEDIKSPEQIAEEIWQYLKSINFLQE